MVRGVLLAAGVALVSLVAAAASPATSTYADRVVGAEFPPITSTLGTFLGVARGGLPGEWRVQIAHQPLSGGATVAITGGAFAMRTSGGRRLAAPVTGGTVTVLDRGAGCTDQRYAVDATLSLGRFQGTLTHHRRSVLGRCLVYAATISGRATLTA